MAETTTKLLTHHWALDELAAEALTSVIDNAEHERIQVVAAGLGSVAVQARDQHRADVTASYTGESQQQVFVEGPCSVDAETNYEELFDVIEWLQDEHPQTKVGVRINGKKPRTKGGWRGLAYSTDPNDRERLHEILNEAFERQLPIFFEVTDAQELGEFAPYATSYWLGARDMASTALRAGAAGIHLPWAAKNGLDGKTETVRNTLLSGRMNSADSEGSGFNLGTIAAGPHHRGVATGILPMGEGNPAGAIIARGYPLPENISPQEGRRLAIEHISQLCGLAKDLNRKVLIDKTHGAPAMLGIERENNEDYDSRLVVVSHEISTAIETGEIKNAEYIGGEVAEIGTHTGRTDPNFIVNWENKEILSGMMGRAIAAV